MEQQDAFLDGFIALIKSRDLQLGGGPTSGFVCGIQKNSDSTDIKVVREFLSAWPSIEQVTNYNFSLKTVSYAYKGVDLFSLSKVTVGKLALAWGWLRKPMIPLAFLFTFQSPFEGVKA